MATEAGWGTTVLLLTQWSFIDRRAPPTRSYISDIARSSTSGICSGIVRRPLAGASGSRDRSTSARSRRCRRTPGRRDDRACPVTRSGRPPRRSPATRPRRRGRRWSAAGSGRCGRPVLVATRCVSPPPRRLRRTCLAAWRRPRGTAASSASRS